MQQKPPQAPPPTTEDAEPDDLNSIETNARDPAEIEDRASSRRRKLGGHSESAPIYTVGYGRPPKNTQFKPGQSGNPKGRSPQSRNFRTMVDQVVSEKVTIREGDKIRRVPKMEALFRTVMSRAFKGDPRAMASFIVMMKYSGYGAEAAGSPELLAGIDPQAIVEEFLTRAALQDPFLTRAALQDPKEEDATPIESAEPLNQSKGGRR